MAENMYYQQLNISFHPCAARGHWRLVFVWEKMKLAKQLQQRSLEVFKSRKYNSVQITIVDQYGTFQECLWANRAPWKLAWCVVEDGATNILLCNAISLCICTLESRILLAENTNNLLCGLSVITDGVGRRPGASEGGDPSGCANPWSSLLLQQAQKLLPPEILVTGWCHSCGYGNIYSRHPPGGWILPNLFQAGNAVSSAKVIVGLIIWFATHSFSKQ